MRIAYQIASLRDCVRPWRERGESLALVPTMGNLHEGHMRLVEEARRQARRVVVSVFVNPLQFGPAEDFVAYPRTPAEDVARLERRGAHLLFMPGADEVYPRAPETITHVDVPCLSDDLCGRHRPGHFRGVATIVLKLLNLVQPDLAIFGEKDFQQLLIVRRMVSDLNIPVRIIGVPTVRESDGLAMSSRNHYLSPDERQRAGHLHATLRRLDATLRQGRRDYPRLEREGRGMLEEEGFTVDYVAIRRRDDLAPPGHGDTSLVVLVAARLGGTRLIDNLTVDLESGP